MMQPSQSFLKHMIRLIILLIVFVCMCLISAILYSTRYWPDIYNYINANITIERIPTISELNIQIVEVRYDYTTETYSTTDADYFELSTTDDFDIDEFMTARFDAKTKVKRDVMFEEIKDYRELPNRPIFIDYIFLEDPIEISSKKNNTDNEPRTLRTMFTKQIIEDETNAVLETNINKYTTKMYDNKDTNNNNINILTPKESNPNNAQLVLHVEEYPVHHTTTRERYLIGDEINTELKNQPTTEPLEITTETNDNDFEKEPVKLLKYLVDVSKLSTRRLEDADDSSMMMNSVEDVEEYLVSGEIYTKMKNQPTMEPLEITTETDEDYDTKPVKLLKDLVDMRKLSTRPPEDVEIIANTSDTALSHMTFTNTVFPWVATIFIKNSTDNSQFHYYCDGALLSEKVILTGGRCVYSSNGLVAPENILVFLGKSNLQSMGGNEKLHRVKSVILHHNFTMDYMTWAVHDLALLILDVAAEFDDRVQSACLHNNLVETTEVEEAATTSWGPSGQLLPIFFEKKRSDICLDKTEDIFCATYGANVPLCPNYGGIYVAKRKARWCVQGLFYGDPSYRGLCYNKNVLFTSLRNYYDWIDDYILINANVL